MRTRVVLLAAGLFLLAAPNAALGESLSVKKSGVTYIEYIKHGNRIVKWGEPEFGSPARIRYFLLETPYEFTGGLSSENCRSMRPLAGALPAQITLAAFGAESTYAMQQWERVANVEFVQAASAEEADLLIGAQTVPEKTAFTNLIISPAAGTEVSTITKAAICFNPHHLWRLEVYGSDESTSVRRMLEHELGHVLGLNHPPDSAIRSVMAFSRSMMPFTPADIRGIQFLYGAPHAVRPSL